MKLKHLFENEISEITDPYVAYNYALSRRERIPELEPIIMKDPIWASMYAVNVLKGRWPEAEPIIMKTFDAADSYLCYLPEVRTPSKDVPLVLNNYAIMDVPNTITDEQVLQLLKLLRITTNIHKVRINRKYFEPLIKQKLNKNALTKINVQQIQTEHQIRYLFRRCWDNNDDDFS